MKKLVRLALFAVALKAAFAILHKRQANVLQPAGGPFVPAPTPARTDPVPRPTNPVPERPETPAETSVAAGRPIQESGPPDDLTKLTGVGPVYTKRLNDLGVATFRSLVAADTSQLAEDLQLSEKAVDTWKSQAESLLG